MPSSEPRPDVKCRAPHCWSEYGTPCGDCPSEPRPDPDVRDGDWRCLCGDLNREHEACCFRCGGGNPAEPMPDEPFFTDQQERSLARCEAFDRSSEPRPDPSRVDKAASVPTFAAESWVTEPQPENPVPATPEPERNPYRSFDQIARDEEHQRILALLDSLEAHEAVVNALMAAVDAGADLGSEARAAITALVGLIERSDTPLSGSSEPRKENE